MVMTEDQVTAKLEHTAGVEITSEEVRWRMEKVVQITAATGMTAEGTAKDFNRALRHLKGEVVPASGD
jgi:hypothetical protein